MQHIKAAGEYRFFIRSRVDRVVQIGTVQTHQRLRWQVRRLFEPQDQTNPSGRFAQEVFAVCGIKRDLVAEHQGRFSKGGIDANTSIQHALLNPDGIRQRAKLKIRNIAQCKGDPAVRGFTELDPDVARPQPQRFADAGLLTLGDLILERNASRAGVKDRVKVVSDLGDPVLHVGTEVIVDVLQQRTRDFV